MSDTLRTRIAAVIEAHDPCGLPGGIDCSCGQGFRPDNGSWVERGVEANRLWSEHLADAVIRELGLQPVVINLPGLKPIHCYTTTWEAAR